GAQLYLFRNVHTDRATNAIEQYNSDVQIPAVIVERLFCWQRTIKRLDVIERHVLDMHEAHDDIRDLHARIIDVVLHLDAIAGSLENFDEGVANNGVAHVADVRGLVGIDAGMLDHQLPPIRLFRPNRLWQRHQVPQQLRAIEEDVEITRTGDLHPLNQIDRIKF